MHSHSNTTFARTITSVYGKAGTQWLTRLPTIIEQCAKKWQLTDLKPFTNLTYNYVLFGIQTQNIPIVLKIRCDPKALEKEIAALDAFQEHGAVKIIAHDKEIGAMLLERIVPGNSLVSLFSNHDDMMAIQIAADLLRLLHTAPTPSTFTFPSLEQALPTLGDEPTDLAPFLQKARILRKRLLETQTDHIFLHGDFHYDNILLASNNKPYAIDPEGMIGDPLYDLSICIRNPIKKLVQDSHAQEIILNRIISFSKLLNYDRQRIYDWTYLQATCSAYWSIEDGLDIANHLLFLKILDTIALQRS